MKAEIVKRHIYSSLSHAQAYVLFQDDHANLSQISSPGDSRGSRNSRMKKGQEDDDEDEEMISLGL